MKDDPTVRVPRKGGRSDDIQMMLTLRGQKSPGNKDTQVKLLLHTDGSVSWAQVIEP